MRHRYYPDPLTALERRLDGHSLSAVARHSGCSYTTVWRLAHGMSDDVHIKTVTKLHDAMDDIDDARRGDAENGGGDAAS